MTYTGEADNTNYTIKISRNITNQSCTFTRKWGFTVDDVISTMGIK